MNEITVSVTIKFGRYSKTVRSNLPIPFLMTSVKIPSLQTKQKKPFVKNLAHLKTHTLVSDIGSNSHRTDTNWNIHEREPQWSHHQLYTPYAWTLNKILPKPFRNLCFFFFLYKIVRYFSSHNGVPFYQYNGIVQDLFCLCGWLRLFSYDSN